jgi:hypothetical protein
MDAYQNKSRYFVTTCPEKQTMVYNALVIENIHILRQDVFLSDQVVFLVECCHDQLSSIRNLNVNIYDDER